jgi:myo-inositol-1(or 4)-monophosphatase
VDRLEFSGKLAREAGKLAHTAFGQSATSMKGRHDVLTAMDGEVERYIRAAITARLPDDAIIGEEEGGRGGERVWLIDPIDGTANYARGIPHYCVSIGYLERNVPTVAAIHDPSHDWLYTAARGEGATLDGKRLSVSPVRRPRRSDGRVRLVDPAQHRRLSRAAHPGDERRMRDPPRGVRRAGACRRGCRAERSLLRAAHQRVGLRGGNPARARRPAATLTTFSRARASPRAIP